MDDQAASTLDPISINAQTYIVGSMLIDDACIGPVLADLSSEDFPSGPYKSTFQRIRSLFLSGRPVDPLTVLDAMQGGERYAKFLRECMESTPTAANVLEYCSILRDRTRIGRIRAIAAQLAEADSREDVDALLDKLNGLRADNRVKVVTAAEAARDFMERMKERKVPEYLPWGLPGLDRLLEVELGDDVVLGGYSSAGKTLLSVLFAREQAKQYRVGYYSLETPTRKLVDRAMASMAGVPLGKIKRMSINGQDLHRLAEAANRYAGLNLEHIDGSTLRSAQDIISTALSRRHQIIYIDYLQLLAQDIDGKRLYEKVTALSTAFHRAAQAHGITVVLLSQLTRPEKTGREKKPVQPTMNSFKESGQIENDADVALLLYQEDSDDYQSDRALKIAKNKDGPRDKLFLAFDGPTMTMSERPEDKSREVAAQLAAVGRAAKRANRACPSGQTQFVPTDERTPFD